MPSLSEQTDAILSSKIKSATFPSFEDGVEEEMAKYRVFYLQGTLSDESFVSSLEEIETKGLLGKEIVLLTRDTYTFESEFFIVLKYMQKMRD